MKYPNQDKQYMKGSWRGDGVPSRMSRKTKKPVKVAGVEPGNSPYATYEDRKLARDIRRDEREAGWCEIRLNRLRIRDAKRRYKN
jgi:hypothetical protein